MNNLIYIIMDSCRFDSYVSAKTPNINRIGKVERRYSFASWTSPSHYAMLIGVTPHTSPRGVFASEIYKEDFEKWRERLDIPDLDFQSFVPELSLPCKLRKMGYRTIGKVSLPLLNQYTTFSQHFDEYKLMDDHDDFAGMIDEVEFDNNQSSFYFLNLGETHYPYMLAGDKVPILHGVHGVFKHMDSEGRSPKETKDLTSYFFDTDRMLELRQQQIRAVEYIDDLFDKLYQKCPSNTYFIVTSDHGELFGEDGYFGHGPIFHPKVFEVPFVEGKLSRV